MQFHGGFNIGGFSQGLFSGMNEMQKIQSAYYDNEAKAQAAATGKAAEAAKNQQAIQTSDATKNAADQAAAAAAGAKGPPSMQQPGEATAPLAQVAGPVSPTPTTGQRFSQADLTGLTMQPAHLAPAQALPLPPPAPGATPAVPMPASTTVTDPAAFTPNPAAFPTSTGNGSTRGLSVPPQTIPTTPSRIGHGPNLNAPVTSAIPNLGTPPGQPAGNGSTRGLSVPHQRALLAPGAMNAAAHTFNGTYRPMGMHPPISAPPQQAIPAGPAAPAGAPQTSPAAVTSNPLGLGGGTTAALPSLANGQQSPLAGIYNNYNPGP